MAKGGRLLGPGWTGQIRGLNGQSERSWFCHLVESAVWKDATEGYNAVASVRSSKSKTLNPGGYEFSFRKNLSRACRHRTFFRNWPHFDRTSVFQTGELFDKGNRFLEAARRQQAVSADGFFRFRERAVHNLAVFPREDRPLVDKRLSALDFAGCAQLFIPRLELAQDLLDFFRRSVVLPFAAAN